MRKFRLILLAATTLITGSVFSQTEREQVTAVIETYFDGWTTSDTTKISKAMHSTCHLKVYRDGIFRDVPKNQYLGGFKEIRAKDPKTTTSILSMDITENIAQAKAKIETEKAIFIDYFNLVKTNEGWFIVDKVSVRTDKK